MHAAMSTGEPAKRSPLTLRADLAINYTAVGALNPAM
jgi:hypothetical protein